MDQRLNSEGFISLGKQKYFLFGHILYNKGLNRIKQGPNYNIESKGHKQSLWFQAFGFVIMENWIWETAVEMKEKVNLNRRLWSIAKEDKTISSVNVPIRKQQKWRVLAVTRN